jgi:small-conductance mechanosensitive channel
MNTIDILHTVVLNNEIESWGLALATLLLGTFVLTLVQRQASHVFMRRAARTTALWDDALAAFLSSTKIWFLAFAALVGAALFLKLSPQTDKVLSKIFIVAFIAQVGVWASALANFYFTKYLRRKGNQDAASLQTLGLIGILVKFVLFSILTLAALHNVGINVTAFVAGLGVGGIAVALAVQSILSDLFASLSIVLDKPFRVGDFIAVGDFLGSVERIGLKTTRVRSLSGEQLIFSNTDLLQSRIKNYKRMLERRVVLSLGVAQETSPEKLKKIPDMVKRAVLRHEPKVRFERSHFYRFGEYTLDFETVYWVLDPDYNLYMDIHQAIHLELLEGFATDGIELAYPTRTLHLRRDASSTSLAVQERG